jgi:hypothetical protein
LKLGKTVLQIFKTDTGPGESFNWERQLLEIERICGSLNLIINIIVGYEEETIEFLVGNMLKREVKLSTAEVAGR